MAVILNADNGVVSGISGLTTTADNSGVLQFQSSGTATLEISTAGNINIPGTGKRITGDFSNATIANRVIFQTTTTNQQTSIGLLPNGTSTTTNLNLFGGTDPANASIGQFVMTGTEVRLGAINTGSGTLLPMTFYTGNSERMRIDTSGNVGIGTSSPSNATLDVVGNANTVALAARGRSSDNLSGIAFRSNNAVSEYAYLQSGPTFLAFGTNGSERMRIDSAGNVGIGTSSPASFLHVNASTAGGGGIFSRQGYNYATVSQLGSSADAIFGGGVIADSTATQVVKTVGDRAHYIKIQIDDGITFHTDITGAAGTSVSRGTNERVRVTSGGNLLAYKTVQVTTNSASTSGTATFYTRLTSSTSYTVATGTIQGIDSMATATLEYANLYDYGTPTNWAYGLRQAFIRSSTGGTTSQGNNSINAQTSGSSATAPTFAWSGTSPITLVVTNGGSVEGWARVTVAWRNVAMTFNPVS
jgi:hypothetical protein